MPIFYMLTGVVASGKSTWCANSDIDAEYVSSDFWIDKYAASIGQTYSEVFDSYIKTATQYMHESVQDAVKHNRNIIWDQTNLTPKSRKSKLAMIPDHYEKIAVAFPVPEMVELSRRLESRPGKHIPVHVVESMINNYVLPTLEEGFDQVINPWELTDE